MSIREVVSVAAAELRSRRLVRTWLFAVLAVVAVLASHALVALAHARHFGGGVLVDVYTPRFAVSWLGAVWLWLFLVAAVFLAFDTRLRDQRERVVDVLDTRRISNVELLGGRLAGVVLTLWLPLVAATCLIQLAGLASQAVQGIGGGEPVVLWSMSAVIEPVSLAGFLLMDALPALALMVAIVLFLASSLNNRLLTVFIALTLVGLHIAALGMLPVYLVPAASLVANHAEFASDIVPRFADGQVLGQRASLLLFAGGFLAFAAATDPRHDDGSPRRRIGVGMVLLVLGAAGVASVALDGMDELRARERWLAAHEAVETNGLPDVQSISGHVRIDPGKALDLDLDLRVSPPGVATDRLVFSFNPGLGVSEITVEGRAATFSHQDGLLTVDLVATDLKGSEVAIGVKAVGVPDPAFAYLDSAVDWRRLNSGNPLLLLGTDAAIFESEYVALVPDSHWLPTAGPNIEDLDRGSDFHDIDLTVQAPDGWLVAAPGRRRDTPAGFRFAPNAPVPGVGMFAAPFQRRAVEVGGVEFELLVTRRHLHNVHLFAAAQEGLVEWLGQRLDDVERLGLSYPYGAFSVVEVPARFRSYAGGWRLDTALFPPGMMLMRETGFPLARLDGMLHNRRYSFGPDSDDAGRKVGVLRMVSGWTRTGGTYHHAARNLVAFQTGATGRGAEALDLVSRELTTKLVLPDFFVQDGRERSPTDFSGHQFDLRSRLGVGFGPLVGRLLGGPYPDAMQATSNRPPVWEAAQGTALVDIADSDLDARLAVDTLSLKGGALVKSIIDASGRSEASRFLAELLDRHRGANYELRDLLDLGRELETDVPSMAERWLTASGMPGFLASDVTVVRIADDDQGGPRYQLLLHVRNGEPTPGVIGLVIPPAFGPGELVRIPGRSAVEIGRVLAAPPREVWLQPYLSLNRRLSQLTVADVDSASTVDQPPFVGARPSDWRPKAEEAIVVDDLDSGFSVHALDSERRWFADPPGPPEDAVLDQGLPEFRRTPTAWWTRQELPTAHGRYRRTAARAWQGEGQLRATFAATLPTTGRWRLEFHVPDLGRVSPFMFVAARDGLGEHHLELVDANGGVTEIGFDPTEGVNGWNRLGDFELDAGDVRVEVTDRTTGFAVVADAIRWTPVSL